MTTYSTLCLGSRADAATWGKGCEGLGFDQGKVLRDGSPTAEEITAFFSTKADWLYLGGHYISDLYNETSTVHVAFHHDHISVTINGAETRVDQEMHALDGVVKVILYGGCSMLSRNNTVKNFRKLFGAHVLLGFSGTTGKEMVDTMLGGGAMSRGHFFDNVRTDTATSAHIVDSWMQAAKKWYGTGPNESKFRAIGVDGKIFKLSSGEIVEAGTVN